MPREMVTEDNLYPWGNEWKDNHAVLKEATPEKVGSRPEGNNRWGVQDLDRQCMGVDLFESVGLSGEPNSNSVSHQRLDSNSGRGLRPKSIR